jgi:hypothetical protein
VPAPRPGGNVLLAAQHDLLVELGYFIKGCKLTPVMQVSRLGMVGTDTGDARRASVGANYWISSTNVSVKGAYAYITRPGTDARHEFTVQLQVFYV